VLEIDLGARTTRVVTPPHSIFEKFIGGRGLAAFFLRRGAGLAFDDPAMPICIFPGFFAGTDVPSAGYTSILCRSALTGTIGDVRAGGGLGGAIRRAGYDGIVVTGGSPSPVGVEVDNLNATVVDATDFEAARCGHADDEPGVCILAAGEAAFRQIRFSTPVVDDGCITGRGGIGPAFAAKNFVFLRVRGTGTIPVADESLLRQATADIRRLIDASPVLTGARGLSRAGAAGIIELLQARRMLPTSNFRRTAFDGFNGRMTAQAEAEDPSGCPGCPVRCQRNTRSGRPTPGFDALAHFTALIDNPSVGIALQCIAFCAETGIDPLCAASAIACLSEMEGRTIDRSALLDLLCDLLAGRNQGAQLRDGSFALAACHGQRELSMSVKGLDLPAIDPRGAAGLALGYAVSSVGGCWQRSIPFGYELFRKPVPLDRFSFSAKARLVKTCEDAVAAFDALGVCHHMFFAVSLDEYAAAFHALTGLPMTGADLATAGERIDYGERLLNDSFGVAGEDDLPARFFSESGTAGVGFDVPPIDRDAFLRARALYYQLRGLDENGWPSVDVADILGVEWND